MANRKNPPLTPVQRTERAREMVVMRRSGASMRDIARHFNVSTQTVHAAVHDALAQSLALTGHEADLLRQQELERLDAVQLAAWPAAMNGHIDSLKIVAQAIDRRCKLLGLDAPAQLEVISIGAIEAEMRRIDAQLALADAQDTDEGGPSASRWIDGELVDRTAIAPPAALQSPPDEEPAAEAEAGAE